MQSVVELINGVYPATVSAADITSVQLYCGSLSSYLGFNYSSQRQAQEVYSVMDDDAAVAQYFGAPGNPWTELFGSVGDVSAAPAAGAPPAAEDPSPAPSLSPAAPLSLNRESKPLDASPPAAAVAPTPLGAPPAALGAGPPGKVDTPTAPSASRRPPAAADSPPMLQRAQAPTPANLSSSQTDANLVSAKVASSNYSSRGSQTPPPVRPANATLPEMPKALSKTLGATVATLTAIAATVTTVTTQALAM